MYCGCLMTGKERKKIKSSTRGRNVEGEVLRQNKKTRGEKKCERVLQGNRDSVLQRSLWLLTKNVVLILWPLLYG